MSGFLGAVVVFIGIVLYYAVLDASERRAQECKELAEKYSEGDQA